MASPVDTRPFAPFRVDAGLALSARAPQGGVHLRHRRRVVPRHHAGRRDAHHRHGGDERLPQGSLREDPRPQRPHRRLQGRRSTFTDYRRHSRQDSRPSPACREPFRSIEGQVMVSSNVQALGGVRARHSARPISSRCRSSPTTSSSARSTASTTRPASPSACGLRIRSASTSGDHAHAHLAAWRVDAVRHGAAIEALRRCPPSSSSACPSTTRR